MIILDGMFGEGGGSLLRTALALAQHTGKAFKIEHIRANRSEPGLKAQHLTALLALKQICNAKVTPVQIGSSSLEFIPGIIKPGRYILDIGTAGSISLVLQALALPLLLSKKKVTLEVKGGTCGEWQPSCEYLKYVLLPHLRSFGRADFSIKQRGYYPAGGGVVEIRFNSEEETQYRIEFAQTEQNQHCVRLEKQGTLTAIKGIAHASLDLMGAEVAERIAQEAERTLQQFKVPLRIETSYQKAASPGAACVLWAVCSEHEEVNQKNPVILGADVVGRRGISSEQVGRECAQRLAAEIRSGAAADEHLADQLIPYLGLGVPSLVTTSRITNHTLTNIYVAERFLPVKYAINGLTVICQ